ncbi:hypothetical protein ACF08N_08015 [Streptomyces sp. NPDC015127]|uniref:hypothetical protein n=1 Tax=Streptomyces sp. NPDC015127 TaxID=3364939 RepID=UPI0036FC7A16
MNVPLQGLKALPLQAPQLSTGVPLLTPGAPEGPRFVTGNLLPENTVPSVPLTGELAPTLLELPVENPLGEGNLGVGKATSTASDLKLASPGATLGAPLTQPRAESGLPEPTLPAVGLIAPVVQGSPTAALGLD